MRYVHQSLVLQGYSKIQVNLSNRKPKYERQLIQLRTGVEFFLSNSEGLNEKLESEIEKEKKKWNGWGLEFEDWSCVLKGYYDDNNIFVPSDPTSQDLRSWKMEKILKELTASEFLIFMAEQQATFETLKLAFGEKGL